jgi:hypothetical protein
LIFPIAGVKLNVTEEGVVVTTDKILGEFGKESVVIEFDGKDDDNDVPCEFVAVAVKVYEVFAVNPLIVIGE